MKYELILVKIWVINLITIWHNPLKIILPVSMSLNSIRKAELERGLAHNYTWHLKKLVLKLVVCLSTNGERALNYTIVKWLILTTNTQATK